MYEIITEEQPQEMTQPMINPEAVEPLRFDVDEFISENEPDIPIMEPVYGDDYTNVLTATPVENVKTQDYQAARAGTWEISQVVPYIDSTNITTTSTFDAPTANCAKTITLCVSN